MIDDFKFMSMFKYYLMSIYIETLDSATKLCGFMYHIKFINSV